jgi:hypothetical protein
MGLYVKCFRVLRGPTLAEYSQLLQYTLYQGASQCSIGTNLVFPFY